MIFQQMIAIACHWLHFLPVLTIGPNKRSVCSGDFGTFGKKEGKVPYNYGVLFGPLKMVMIASSQVPLEGLALIKAKIWSLNNGPTILRPI